MNSIITNAHVTVNGNEILSYTVPSIIVFTDTPADIETARKTVSDAVKTVFDCPVTVVFEFEK